MHQNMKMRNDWYVISTASIKNKVTFSQFMFIRNSITNSWADVNIRRKTLVVLGWKNNIFTYYSILDRCTPSIHITLHIHIKYNTSNEVLLSK